LPKSSTCSVSGGASIVLAIACSISCPQAALAGPPFRTDDPIPLEQGHWEVFGFSSGTHVPGDTSGTLFGIDANYGATPDLQLHAALPLAFDAPNGQAPRIGYGDTELGFKYRFMTGDDRGWRPDAAIYPAIDFPTGNAAKNLGSGNTRVFLPLWLQKSLGNWTTFAGPGYWSNPGTGNRNFWYFGWAVQYQIKQNFSLGAEIFHQTAQTRAGKGQTGIDVGAIYDLSDHYHLMFAIGPGIQNAATTDRFSYYASLQCTF
jgi:hypothetical protein